MQIISCCTVLCIVLLAVLCADNDNESEDSTVKNTSEVTKVSGASCDLTSPNFIHPDKLVMHVPLLSEEEKANLTCSAPFPCPKTPPEITWWIWTGERNITDLKDNITLTNSKNLSTLTLTPASNLYNATVGCVVSYGNKTISTNRNLRDMYLRILGNGKVMEGGTLNLSCTVESQASSSVPVWSFSGTNGTTPDQFLTIHNVTKKNAGVYSCTRTYENKTLRASITIDVNHLRILGNDKVMEGDTLNLSCTVESHPSSSVPEWSFNGTNGTTDRVNQTSAEFLTINNMTKKNAGVYSCTRTYGNKKLSASITIHVIPNTNGLNKSSSPGSKNNRNTTAIEDFFMDWDISKILTFVAGMACSALIFSMVLCCWVSCHRNKKHKVPTKNPDTDVNLVMVQTDVAQTGTNEETPLHGQPNGVNPNTAGPTDGAEEEGAVGMDVKEVDYASIDYSLLKDRAAEEEEKEPTDTDYAEIKKDKRGNGNEGEVLSDGDDQAETTDQIEEEELELELELKS